MQELVKATDRPIATTKLETEVQCFNCSITVLKEN